MHVRLPRRRNVFLPLCAAWVTISLSIFAMSSCSNGPENPPVFPVTGQVLYNSNPVDGATVSFLGDGTGRPAYGITDAQGKFKLTTFKQDDGALPGKHRVSVSKSVKAAADDDGSMEAAEKRANEPVVEPKSAIPERYADWNKSELEFTVSESSPNDFKIELKD